LGLGFLFHRVGVLQLANLIYRHLSHDLWLASIPQAHSMQGLVLFLLYSLIIAFFSLDIEQIGSLGLWNLLLLILLCFGPLLFDAIGVARHTDAFSLD